MIRGNLSGWGWGVRLAPTKTSEKAESQSKEGPCKSGLTSHIVLIHRIYLLDGLRFVSCHWSLELS